MSKFRSAHKPTTRKGSFDLSPSANADDVLDKKIRFCFAYLKDKHHSCGIKDGAINLKKVAPLFDKLRILSQWTWQEAMAYGKRSGLEKLKKDILLVPIPSVAQNNDHYFYSARISRRARLIGLYVEDGVFRVIFIDPRHKAYRGD